VAWPRASSSSHNAAPARAAPWLASELVRRGYRDRVVISHDASRFIDSFPDGSAAAARNWNLRLISEAVIHGLLERGPDEADLEAILAANPRRYFDGA
jgi:phosphotriesterase-related protein